jgi:hypothetical protein
MRRQIDFPLRMVCKECVELMPPSEDGLCLKCRLTQIQTTRSESISSLTRRQERTLH